MGNLVRNQGTEDPHVAHVECVFEAPQLTAINLIGKVGNVSLSHLCQVISLKKNGSLVMQFCGLIPFAFRLV